MNPTEFSNEFDVLYNNIMSNAAPGLNEYEKSVFLTKAQEELSKNYLNPLGNRYKEGVDDSQKRQIDFSTITQSTILSSINAEKFDDRSLTYSFPDDILVALNEKVSDNSRQYTVIPLRYDEYMRLMSRPYKYPTKFQVWRLISSIPVGAKLTRETFDSLITTPSGTIYKLTLASSYGKPIEFILRSASTVTETYGNPPTVIETDSLVTITCIMKVSIPSVTYWNAYLKGNNTVTYKYLGSFEGTSPESSVFPAISAGDNANVGLWFDSTIDGGSPATIKSVSEIIGNFDKTSITYKLRYIRKPKPIILVNLREGYDNITINGYSEPRGSELPVEMHPEILQRAVELAKAAYEGDLKSMVELGQRSE